MTRGGKLTILNCLMWAAVAVGLATDTPQLLWPAFVACWPIAWLFIMPVFGRVTPVGSTEVMACVMIGINSLLWGYGISGLVGLASRQKLHPPGFDVVPRRDEQSDGEGDTK